MNFRIFKVSTFIIILLVTLGLTSYTIATGPWWAGNFSSPTQVVLGGVDGPPTEPDPYTVLLIHFDAEGNSFTDSSTQSATITPVGGVTQSAVQSKFGGKSAYFDGGGDYLTLPDADSFNMGTGAWAVDFWFYAPDQTLTQPTLITTQGGWSAGAHAIRFDNTGQVQKVSFFSNVLGDPYLTSTTAYALNTWHHVALVRNENSVTQFVNGQADGWGNISAGTTFDWSYGTSLVLGWSPWDGAAGYYQGFIDELRVSKGTPRWVTTFSPSSTAYTR